VGGAIVLASLLPGLRDVRTPLTVGYLWLIALWLWLPGWIPVTPPGDGGAIDRMFRLGGLVERAGVLAAVSLSAYVLGVLLTLSERNRVVRRLQLLGRNPEARSTRQEYARFLSASGDELEDLDEERWNRELLGYRRVTARHSDRDY
jgi:hypothetical protein